MGFSIREITYNDVKSLNIKDNRLIFSPTAKYFAIVKQKKVVSVTAVKENKKGVKLQANYTFPEYRNRGLFSFLLKNICKKYSNYDIYADCLNTSVSIYINQGFDVYDIKEFKRFTLYKVRMLRNETICKENR